jgi:hypothetical protein
LFPVGLKKVKQNQFSILLKFLGNGTAALGRTLSTQFLAISRALRAPAGLRMLDVEELLMFSVHPCAWCASSLGLSRVEEADNFGGSASSQFVAAGNFGCAVGCLRQTLGSAVAWRCTDVAGERTPSAMSVFFFV